MRVTNMMMMKSMNYNLEKNLSNMNDMYTQLSTGKSFQTTSEDPVNAAKSVLYTSYLTEIEQYQANAADATSRLSITESSVSNLQEVLEQVRELTVQAANETLSEDDRLVVLSEVEVLQEQLFEISNATYAGDSIFGGYNVAGAPFEVSDDDLLTYNGSALCLTGPYSDTMSDSDILSLYNTYENDQITSDLSNQNMVYNVGDNSQVDVNIEGQELFGAGENSVFAVMEKLMMALEGDTSYKTINNETIPPTVIEQELDLSSLIGELDDCLDGVRSINAEVGARKSYVEMTSNRLNQDYYTYTALLSSNEDVDIAEVSMKLANAEAVYSASLASGAKIIMPSLVDFIR